MKVGDHERISKYKNNAAKGYTPTWSEKVFIIKKAKNTVPWIYVIDWLSGKEIIERFYEKPSQNSSHTEFRVEKVVKKKGVELSVKWKGYDNLFNSWIYKKDIIM